MSAAAALQTVKSRSPICPRFRKKKKKKKKIQREKLLLVLNQFVMKDGVSRAHTIHLDVMTYADSQSLL